jgi:hypothetical protein
MIIFTIAPGLKAEKSIINQEKNMSSSYFGLHVKSQFEARVPEFDAMYTLPQPRMGGVA